MATHSSILAWRTPGAEVPGSPQFMGSQRVRHDWATITSPWELGKQTHTQCDLSQSSATWQSSGGIIELPVRTRLDKAWVWDSMLPSHTTMVKNSNIKSSYKRESIHLGCDVDSDFAGPAIHGSAVLDCEGWLAGFHDLGQCQIKANKE